LRRDSNDEELDQANLHQQDIIYHSVIQPLNKFCFFLTSSTCVWTL